MQCCKIMFCCKNYNVSTLIGNEGNKTQRIPTRRANTMLVLEVPLGCFLFINDAFEFIFYLQVSSLPFFTCV